MDNKHQKHLPAFFLACLIGMCLFLGNGRAMASTTLISQMDEVEVSPNVSRFDSFKTNKAGSIKVSLTGDGECTAALYYAGEDWDSVSSGNGDFIKEAAFSLSSAEQSFTASAAKKGVYNLVLSTEGSGSIICNTKAYLVTGSDAFALDKKKVSLKVGQTAQLRTSGSTGKVTWSTSNSKVAKVSSSGKVTALKEGTATVAAKNGSKKVTCKVTVTGQTIKLNIKKVTITEGEDIQLLVKGGTGKISWTSNNIYVAQVSSDGTVTGISRGTASIMAVRDGVTLKCQVMVEE